MYYLLPSLKIETKPFLDFGILLSPYWLYTNFWHAPAFHNLRKERKNRNCFCIRRVFFCLFCVCTFRLPTDCAGSCHWCFIRFRSLISFYFLFFSFFLGIMLCTLTYLQYLDVLSLVITFVHCDRSFLCFSLIRRLSDKKVPLTVFSMLCRFWPFCSLLVIVTPHRSEYVVVSKFHWSPHWKFLLRSVHYVLELSSISHWCQSLLRMHLKGWFRPRLTFLAHCSRSKGYWFLIFDTRTV